MLFVSLVLLIVAQISKAEYIPGTTISMSPPPGFELSQGFAGFLDPADNSSITISELPPEAYANVAVMFSSQEAAAPFSAQGVHVSGHDLLVVGEDKVPFLTGTQLVSGIEVTKYMALLRSEKTVLITFNLMDGTRLKKSDAIASVKSVRSRAAPTIQEQVEQLQFVFEEVKPFKTNQILQGTTVLLSTSDATDPTGRIPISVITLGSVRESALDQKSLSEQLALSTVGFADASITESRSTIFAESDGHYVKASSGESLLIQYVYAVGDYYIRSVSLGEKNAVMRLEKRIDKLAGSIKLK